MRVIHTIKEFKGDINTLFNAFVDDLVSQELIEVGTRYSLIEIGPREDYSTIIQIVVRSHTTIKVDVSLSQNLSNIDVNYASTAETDFSLVLKTNRRGVKKIQQKLGEDGMQKARDASLVPLIQKSITRVVKSLQEKPVGTTAEDPLTILQRKFVNGEISEEEYLHKKELLNQF